MKKELHDILIKLGWPVKLKNAEDNEHYFVYQFGLKKLSKYYIIDQVVLIFENIYKWYLEEIVSKKHDRFQDSTIFELRFGKVSDEKKLQFLEEKIEEEKELLKKVLNELSDYGESVGLLGYIKNKQWKLHIKLNLVKVIKALMLFLDGENIKHFKLPGNAPWSPGYKEFKNIFDELFLNYLMKNGYEALAVSKNIEYLQQTIHELSKADNKKIPSHRVEILVHNFKVEAKIPGFEMRDAASWKEYGSTLKESGITKSGQAWKTSFYSLIHRRVTKEELNKVIKRLGDYPPAQKLALNKLNQNKE